MLNQRLEDRFNSIVENYINGNRSVAASKIAGLKRIELVKLLNNLHCLCGGYFIGNGDAKLRFNNFVEQSLED